MPVEPRNIRGALVRPIIISGPSGSGKTRYAQVLAAYYGKPAIIDDYNSLASPSEDALYLTQGHYPGAISIGEALRVIGIVAK